MSKAFSLIAAGAYLAVLSGASNLWADQQTPPIPPGSVIPVNPMPSASETAPAAAKPSLRDKLFHGPWLTHPKAPCWGCSSIDPDMSCGTCRSEWIFLFGSCRAFYGER